MKRISTSIVIAVAALSISAAGCSKDKDKAKDKGAATPAAAAAAAAKGDTAKPAERASGETAFSAFPADSEFVLSFSLDSLRTSPMWAQIAPMVQAKLDAEMKDVKEACGFDPVSKLVSVQVGGKPSDEKSMVVVLKGFSKAEMTTCGAAMAKKESKEFSVTEEDGLTVVKSDGKDVYMSWLSDDTAVMSPNPDKAWVKARVAGQGGLDGNAAFMELAKKVDPSATIWFSAMPAAGSEMDMSKSVAGAKGLYASVKVSNGLGIDAGMRFDTPENAKNALTMATAGMQQGKAMMPPAVQTIVDKVKLANAANDLSIQLQLTDADIQALTGALAPMLGGMMGGMAK